MSNDPQADALAEAAGRSEWAATCREIGIKEGGDNIGFPYVHFGAPGRVTLDGTFTMLDLEKIAGAMELRIDEAEEE